MKNKPCTYSVYRIFDDGDKELLGKFTHIFYAENFIERLIVVLWPKKRVYTIEQNNTIIQTYKNEG